MTADRLEALLRAAERAAERQRRWELVHAATFAFRVTVILFLVCSVILGAVRPELLTWGDYVWPVIATLTGAFFVAGCVMTKAKVMVRCEGKAHHALADLARGFASSSETAVELAAHRLGCLDIGFDRGRIAVIVFGHPHPGPVWA